MRPAALVLVPALAAASGCGRASAPSSSADARATIVQSSVSLGDPHIVSDSTNRLSLLFSVYEPLVALDDAGAFQPSLAERWAVSADARTWTFTLRKGVVFHNGAKFSAEDVVYILNYASNPDSKVKYWTYVNWIKEVKKIDDYKVQIITHKPFPAAIEFLSCAMPIYPKDYYAQVGSKGFGVKPIGTGPYKVADVEPGKKIVLEAFDKYFAGSPKG